MHAAEIVDPLNLRLLSLDSKYITEVESLRTAYRNLSLALQNAPANREISLAKTNLEQSLMWAVKAYCVESEKKKGGD